MQPFVLDLIADTVTVRIDKARAQLGYAPVIDFEAGVRELKEWVQKQKLQQQEAPAPAAART